MINICPACGNYEWDKKVTLDSKQIICPKCGHCWDFQAFPIFILTGCSGVGKTTTAQELLQRDTKYIVLDADFLYNIMPHETEKDFQNWLEQIMSLSKNIMQCGKPLLWTMAGVLDKFENTYNRQFFTEICYLALVCDSKDLEDRMREGRHITDDNWIQGSLDYNDWFRTNGMINDRRVETFDITGKNVSEVADYVDNWVNERL